MPPYQSANGLRLRLSRDRGPYHHRAVPYRHVPLLIKKVTSERAEREHNVWVFPLRFDAMGALLLVGNNQRPNAESSATKGALPVGVVPEKPLLQNGLFAAGDDLSIPVGLAEVPETLSDSLVEPVRLLVRTLR